MTSHDTYLMKTSLVWHAQEELRATGTWRTWPTILSSRDLQSSPNMVLWWKLLSVIVESPLCIAEKVLDIGGCPKPFYQQWFSHCSVECVWLSLYPPRQLNCILLFSLKWTKSINLSGEDRNLSWDVSKIFFSPLLTFPPLLLPFQAIWVVQSWRIHIPENFYYAWNQDLQCCKVMLGSNYFQSGKNAVRISTN